VLTVDSAIAVDTAFTATDECEFSDDDGSDTDATFAAAGGFAVES